MRVIASVSLSIGLSFLAIVLLVNAAHAAAPVLGMLGKLLAGT
jgi:hypothetical protein